MIKIYLPGRKTSDAHKRPSKVSVRARKAASGAGRKGRKMKECLTKYGFVEDGSRVYSENNELILETVENQVVRISPKTESDILIDLALCIISKYQWDNMTCHGNKSFLLKVANKVIPRYFDEFELKSLQQITFKFSDKMEFSDSDIDGPQAKPRLGPAEDEEDDETPAPR